MNKQYRPNIVRGGVALPLGNNYYFMKGRKHKQGGIDVGKDLEVEDGEIMKVSPKEVKVFSSVPFLNGQSPVEKLLGGENPNKVFAQQERFKKINKINDDGTKAQLGKGKKITTTEIPESQQYAVTTPDGQRKVFNSKQEASDYVTANTPKGYSLYDITNYGSNIDKGQTAILNRNTEREIEKATEQEELAKARLATRQQNQEIGKEMLSYMPVIGDGMDLYQLGKDAYNGNYLNAGIGLGLFTLPNIIEKPIKYVGKGIKKLFKKQIKSSKDINTKNLQNITDAEWDELYNKTIKNNDLEEAQRLRDLHWKQKTPNNKIINKQYHVVGDNYDPNFTIFDPKENHTSIYTTDNIDMASSYSKYWLSNEEKLKTLNNFREKDISYKNKIIKDLQEELKYRQNNNKSNNYEYESTESLNKRLDIELKELELLNDDNNFQNYYNFYNTIPQPNRVKKLNIYLKNPIQIDNNGYNWNNIRISDLPKDVYDNIKVDRRGNPLDGRYSTLSLENVSKDLGYDGVIIDNITDYGKHWGNKYIDFNTPHQVVITNNKNRLKLSDAITYDDNGNIIPLSKRDDFTNPDIRYNWLLPTIGVGTGLSLINNNENNQYKYGGKMNRQKAPFGILKKIGQSLGIVEEDNKHNFPKDYQFESAPKKINTIEEDILNGKVYIGGKPNEARQKYFDLDKEFTDSVKSISKRYGINPNVVASRLAKEGPIDTGITLVNQGIGFNRGVVQGPAWGLDDLGTHIEEGRVNIKEDWNKLESGWQFDNEKGRTTNTVYSPNWSDGISGIAAEIKYRRDYMKKHFPNMTDEELDAAAAASFNRGNYGTRKWIKNGGNYMQYKPFIKLKQMGGNHKLNTNQMANIYRIDSNGKTSWGMNISTGDKLKNKQKALYGTKQRKSNQLDSFSEYWKTVIATNPLTELIYAPSVDETQYYDKDLPEVNITRNVRVAPTNTSVDEMDVNREIPKNYVSTKSNSPKSTTNNKSVNYSVTIPKQTTPKQITPGIRATVAIPKSNVTKTTPKQITPNNIIRTTTTNKIASSKKTPIFGLAEQEAFKKSIVGSKANPDYIRGTFDFRDSKELVNKVNPNTIKVNPTNIRYKDSPSNGGYFKNYNTGDYISLGTNILGNIGSALINKHTLDNMKYASAPVPKMAVKQKTNFNINPQLDLNRERLREGIFDVNTNTASSSTALNRNNKLRLANIMNTNQLYGTKENMETQLINADRMNQQNVFNSNIDAFNTWNKEKNIFETTKQEKYGENKVGAVQGISQAVHDFINNNEKRKQFNNNLVAIMAANPNVNPRILKELGFEGITDEQIANWERVNKR